MPRGVAIEGPKTYLQFGFRLDRIKHHGNRRLFGPRKRMFFGDKIPHLLKITWATS